MDTRDLKPNTKVVNLVLEIETLHEPTETPTGKAVQDGIGSDAYNQVRITFWENDVGKYKEGDKILLGTGYAKEFEGAINVTAGRFGKWAKIPPKEVID